MISRIVIISDQSVAQGGAEAMAIASAKMFCAAGFPVTFFAGDDGDAPMLRGSGAEIIGAGGTHVLRAGKLTAFRKGLYSPESRHVLEKWIEENDDDGVIYHLHSWSKFLSPSIFAALKTVRQRVIIHAHDFFMICPNGAFMNYRTETPCETVPLSTGCVTTNCDKRNYAEKLWRVARHEIREHLFDATSPELTYLLVHRGMARFFERAGIAAAQLHVVPNPIDFLTNERVLAERNQKICFIGRLDPEKGAMDAALAARDAGVPLQIIGDGVQRAALEENFPEVQMAGWCTPEQVTAHLLDARLLVVPSRWRETFGMVIVEALRLGVPVIVSNKALIADDLADSGAGLSVDTQNIVAFADVLRRLAKADDEVRLMSEKAMDAAARLTMTTPQWRESLLSHYRHVLARSAATVQKSLPGVSRSSGQSQAMYR